MSWESIARAPAAVPPQAVWNVLLDGRRWSFWNPGIEWMWIEGEPVAGTLATIKLRRVRQTAFVIADATAPERFILQLTVGPVARLRIGWTLEPRDGGTLIEGRVAIAGAASGMLLRRPAQRVAAELPASLERLAERAATVASATAPK